MADGGVSTIGEVSHMQVHCMCYQVLVREKLYLSDATRRVNLHHKLLRIEAKP